MYACSGLESSLLFVRFLEQDEILNEKLIAMGGIMEFDVDFGILLTNYKCFLNIQNALIFGRESMYLLRQLYSFLSGIPQTL